MAAQIAAREAAEAGNFAEVMAAAPQGRFVVYVGYSHLRKTPDGRGSLWMARRLMDRTGLDPLTVSQAFTGAWGPHASESPRATAVLERFEPKAPIVVRVDGACLGASEAGADLAVFHPSLPDVHGRPGWLAADALRHRVSVRLPQSASKGLALAQALHSADPDPAIPADQYLLPREAAEAVFFLRRGDYRIRIETEEGFIRVADAVRV